MLPPDGEGCGMGAAAASAAWAGPAGSDSTACMVDDVWAMVLGHLSVADVVRFSMVSRAFNQVAHACHRPELIAVDLPGGGMMAARSDITIRKTTAMTTDAACSIAGLVSGLGSWSHWRFRLRVRPDQVASIAQFRSEFEEAEVPTRTNMFSVVTASTRVKILNSELRKAGLLKLRSVAGLSLDSGHGLSEGSVRGMVLLIRSVGPLVEMAWSCCRLRLDVVAELFREHPGLQSIDLTDTVVDDPLCHSSDAMLLRGTWAEEVDQSGEEEAEAAGRGGEVVLNSPDFKPMPLKSILAPSDDDVDDEYVDYDDDDQEEEEDDDDDDDERQWSSDDEGTVDSHGDDVVQENMNRLVQLMCHTCGDSLTSLNFTRTYIDDPSVAAIAKSCPNLKEINLRGCEKIQKTGCLTAAQALSTVILANTNLQDESLLSLSSLPCLRHIDITDCHLITDVSLWGLSACSLLEGLHIGGNSRVEDQTIAWIALSCPRLKHVDISQCSRLTDRSVHALTRCPHMEDVTVSVDSQMRLGPPLPPRLRRMRTDQCVASFSPESFQPRRQLTDVDMTLFCHGMVDDDVMTALDTLPLRNLNMRRCPGCTAHSMAAIKMCTTLLRLNSCGGDWVSVYGSCCMCWDKHAT